MKSKKCAECGKEYPETTEFFYYNKTWKYFRSKCKECTKRIENARYHKHNPPQKREWDMPAVIGEVSCPCMAPDSKCYVDGCRYHMTLKKDLNKNRIQAIQDSKYTCLFEVIADHPNGLSLEQIGVIMGVTMEAVRQQEMSALTKLKRRMRHLETYNEDDVDTRYDKPRHVFGDANRVSEWKTTPLWKWQFMSHEKKEQ